MTKSRAAPAHESAAVDLLAAATEPTHWRILATLATAGTRCACEIEPVADVAPTVLSYRLEVLREAGLVTSERRGKWIDYSIAADVAIAAWFGEYALNERMGDWLPFDRTRARLGGRREGVGNVMAAGFGVATPFCSCSAVPAFIGFVGAGVVACGIMSTPGLVVDKKVLVSGWVPGADEVATLLAAAS